jgi:hypothetical protein
MTLAERHHRSVPASAALLIVGLLALSGVALGISGIGLGAPGANTLAGPTTQHLTISDAEAVTIQGSNGPSFIVNSAYVAPADNGNGNNSSSPISIPSNLVTFAIILGAVFVISMILIAVGTIVSAVLIPRRLRQLAEVMAKANSPPTSDKPAK